MIEELENKPTMHVQHTTMTALLARSKSLETTPEGARGWHRHFPGFSWSYIGFGGFPV